MASSNIWLSLVSWSLRSPSYWRPSFTSSQLMVWCLNWQWMSSRLTHRDGYLSLYQISFPWVGQSPWDDTKKPFFLKSTPVSFTVHWILQYFLLGEIVVLSFHRWDGGHFTPTGALHFYPIRSPSGPALHCNTLHHTEDPCTALCTVVQGIMLYTTALPCTVQNCIILYGTAHHCTASNWTATLCQTVRHQINVWHWIRLSKGWFSCAVRM